MTRLFLFMFTVFLALPAWAQDSVSVRAGTHSGYVRIVFDWPRVVSYSVKKSDDGLSVSFDRAAALDNKTGDLSQIDFIQSVTATGTQPLSVQITLDKNREYRHFKVGNRVVLDVLGTTSVRNIPSVTATPAPEKVTEPKTVTAEKPKQAEKTKMPSSPAKPVESEALDDEKLSDLEKQEQIILQQGQDIKASTPDIGPHLISVSTTESVGMAAFRRNDNLWIVMDRSNITVPPQLAGPQKELFSGFERFDLKGATAFRMTLPANKDLHIKGEGGGLVWRVIISPNEHKDRSAKPERIFETENVMRGGTLLWPLKRHRKIVEIPDPEVGDIIKAVTVEASNSYSGPRYEFVDMNILPSPIGLAMVQKTNGVEINLDRDGVKITRSGGLALSSEKDISIRKMRKNVSDAEITESANTADIIRIFDFDRWMMGGLNALSENQRIVLSNSANKDKDGRVQDMLALAKVNLANDRGQEALGFLNFAAQELPGIVKSPEYLALRGAAYAAAGKYELALNDLLSPSLKKFTELDYWRSYTLAWLEDWNQARGVLPEDYSILVSYPKELLEKLGVKLAEVALRNADVATAKGILAVLNRERDKLDPEIIAGLDYLKGETHRQNGEYESARKLWRKLVDGPDDFYRVRAGLALTIIDLDDKTITPDEAIDRLEGLRYAWRGDGLEAQINAMLGSLYLDTKKYLKGFSILRDAAGMTPGTDTGREITERMAREFQDLLLEDSDLSPVDAVTVYEEFKELTPPGADGNKLVQKLAERLLEADLLDRSTEILQHQVDFRLQGEDKARVALRLGVVYLLDNEPSLAMDALNTAKSLYQVSDSEEGKGKLREIELLRARALFQMNRTEEAIELLNTFDPSPDVNRLRADIAWQSGLWEDAEEALQDLILDEGLDLSRPLTASQADLILNRAVALNLSGNRVALANMRKRYEKSMKKTQRARLFEVVTRPRKSTVFIDRDTIDSIVSEVDIFRDFLESYNSEALSQ